MILIDTSVIMYAASEPHPNKGPSVRLLEQVATGEVEATIDAEVLQEILHRYRAIHRWEEGKQVYDFTRQLFPVVLPVTAETLDHARRLLDTDATIMVRDALHAAVVIQERLEGLYSYDRGFDRIEGVTRREPAQ